MRIKGITRSKTAKNMKKVCEHKKHYTQTHPDNEAYTQIICATKGCQKVLKTVGVAYDEFPKELKQEKPDWLKKQEEEEAKAKAVQ